MAKDAILRIDPSGLVRVWGELWRAELSHGAASRSSSSPEETGAPALLEALRTALAEADVVLAAAALVGVALDHRGLSGEAIAEMQQPRRTGQKRRR